MGKKVGFKELALLVAIVAMFALMVVSVAAQATAEPYTSATIITDTGAAMTTWNLWPFIIVAGIVGAVMYLLRRSVRAVR